MNKTIFTSDHKEVVRKLIKAREEAGLKQSQVAKILGRSQSYVSKLESGQRRIDLVQIKDLAKIYKKNIEEFI